MMREDRFSLLIALAAALSLGVPLSAQCPRGSPPPRGFMFWKQARQESNLQPPVLERTPSHAGVAAFLDFQGVSSERSTPASLDDAGVGTNSGTAEEPVRSLGAGREAARPYRPVRGGSMMK